MKTILYFQSGLNEDNLAKLEGVCWYAKAARWRVQTVLYADASFGRISCGGDCSDIARLIDLWKPAGAIVESGSLRTRLTAQEFGGLPLVFLDRDAEPGAVCVTSDARAVAEAAAHVLLPLGCAAYGYVPFTADVYWSRDRGLRFAELVRLNGRDCRIFRPEAVCADAGLFSRRLTDWLKAAPRPFGVFAANDYMGVIVLDCARAAGLKVPGDVAVLGVDDNRTLCDRSVPTLSSVIPDFGRAGAVAAELLDCLLSNPPRRVVNATFGVLGVSRRASTFCYRRHDVRVAAAVEYIRRHACGRITSANVVAQMSCARRTAELRFGELVGHSILDEIHAVRLEHAKNLLRQPRASVREVAAACGYRTTEQLRRLFVASEGLSPRAWRQRFGAER